MAGREFNRQTSIMANVSEKIQSIQGKFTNVALGTGQTENLYFYAEHNEVIEVISMRTYFSGTPSTQGATSGKTTFSIYNNSSQIYLSTHNFDTYPLYRASEIRDYITCYPSDAKVVSDNINRLYADENEGIKVSITNNDLDIALDLPALTNQNYHVLFLVRRKKVTNL